MLDLFVLDATSNQKVCVTVKAAAVSDLEQTENWQTDWLSREAAKMPNKVALHSEQTSELLGLMSYEVCAEIRAVKIVYIESAYHSNANLLHMQGKPKHFLGIAKALFAYAVDVSIKQGFDGVLIFRAKTTELLEYYIKEFGARQVGRYDPFQLVIWEDAAERLLSIYRR